MSAEQIAVGFAAALRSEGLDVPVGSVVMFGRALAAVGVERQPAVYWAGRACLVRRPEDIPAFDRVFDSYWLGRVAGAPTTVVETRVTLAVDAPDAPSPEGTAPLETGPVLTVRYSPTEVLRRKDFAVYTSDEFAEARRLMADLRLAGAMKRSRRSRPSRHQRGRPDVRRTVRLALRTAGEPVARAFNEPSVRPRRIVLICDVSGSMEPYARALLRFVHAAVVGRGRVEAFALGTRLTRVTRELSSRDPDAALSAASRRVADWSGGTRLGEGMRTFNDQWGVRGMARGAVVVVLSDGWDRGDPAVLAEQMARLHRVAYRVVWVNPLKASAGYAPLARGMAAALPWVDAFVEGHSLAALEQVAAELGR